MVVRVLGPLDTGTDPLSPRERAVLSALVVRLGTAVAPSELADAWWGTEVPRTWEQQVRNSVARIRSRLGKASIETVGDEYRLAIDPDAIDSVRFERLVSSARGHALRAEQERAVDAYVRALALWRGAPLSDVATWEPGIVEAMRLGQIRESAEEELLDARLAAGEHRAVIPDAERLLREEPLREDRWSILALANYRAGRQADALAVVRAARERLADELGIEPGARLAGLELAMLRQDESLDAPASRTTADATCPYPGLRPFGPDDAAVFFGRDADTEHVLDRALPGALVTIAGASGTGKSSVLLAGVLPRLRGRGHTVEVVRPAGGGANALRRAVERADVLALDQAEELLELSPGDLAAAASIARGFLDAGGTIIATVRSDALDRMRAIPDVGDDFGRGVYLLGALSDSAYRSAIEAPAHAAGLRIEPGLVELAVRDAGDRSTTLPHLSHAMQGTWERREGATLTVEGYRSSGGIPGAIAQSAEHAFRTLSPDDRQICRSLLLRLVERGADGVSTRRRVPAEPLLADSARRRVLDHLTRARLVAFDDDAVVVSHEAVATAWPRLDAWLQEDAAGARTLRAVESAASAWQSGGRDDDDLLRGARLHSALEWRDAAEPDLTPVEGELLVASVAHEQGELRALSARSSRDRRRSRVLGGALAGAGVLLVAALVAGSFAVVQAGEARAAAENAKIEAIVATSTGLRANDRDAAALLAAESYRRWPDDARVRAALMGVATSASGVLATHRTPGADTTTTTAIPGTTTALRVRDGEAGTALEVVDVETGEVVRSLDVPVPTENLWLGNFRDITVSADGRVALLQSGIDTDPAELSAACCWNDLVFIDLATGDALPGSQLLRARTSTRPALADDGSVVYLAHPLTGALIAVDSRSGDVRASDPRPFDDYTGQPGLFNSVAILDDEHVATGVYERIDIFDRRTLALVRSIPLGIDAGEKDLVVDAAGALFASGRGGVVRIDLDTDSVAWELPQLPSDTCFSLVHTTRGTLLCSSLGAVTELDATSGLRSGTSLATQIAWSLPISLVDERTVLIDANPQGAWMLWRTDGTSASIDAIAEGRYIESAPGTDEHLLPTTPIAGGAMVLWDPVADAPSGEPSAGVSFVSGDVVERFEEGTGFSLENISTGKRYPYALTGLPEDFRLFVDMRGPHGFVMIDDRVVAFDPETGRQVGERLGVEGANLADMRAVSQSSDGSLVAINWADAATGRSQIAVLRLSDGTVVARGMPGSDQVLLARDGDLITVGAEAIVRVDTQTLQPMSTLAQADGGSNVLVESDDGRTLLNVGFDNSLRLYDLTLDIPLGDVITAQTDWAWSGGFLSPDGDALYTNSATGILAWDLRPEAQAHAACALAGRELSREEWDTYFPGEPRASTCALLARQD